MHLRRSVRTLLVSVPLHGFAEHSRRNIRPGPYGSLSRRGAFQRRPRWRRGALSDADHVPASRSGRSDANDRPGALHITRVRASNVCDGFTHHTEKVGWAGLLSVQPGRPPSLPSPAPQHPPSRPSCSPLSLLSIVSPAVESESRTGLFFPFDLPGC